VIQNDGTKPLIEDIFLPHEAMTILSIPLNSTNQEDRMTWRGMTKGIFSIKSAYHMAKEGMAKQQPESLDKGELGKIWRALWKLHVPNADFFYFYIFVESMP
jgi:hypothetical protein